MDLQLLGWEPGINCPNMIILIAPSTFLESRQGYGSGICDDDEGKLLAAGGDP